MISSIHEFLKQIKFDFVCNYDEILFFRGLSKDTYDLKPGLFRSKKENAESIAYHDIMMEYPEQFQRNEHLSNLVKMQHYGAETRLLDVTRNPLIALYFACESNPNENAKVACFKIKKNEILHHNSDKALMLACLPAFTDEEKKEIKSFVEKHPNEITDNDIKNSSQMKRFLYEIRSEFPAFETALIGEHLLKNYFVSAHKDNQRMKVQDGAFIICGLNDNVDDLEKIVSYIRIDYKAKIDILKDLKMLGIANNTVYPDFERTSMAIAKDRKVDWVDIYKE